MPLSTAHNVDLLVADLESVAAFCQNALSQCQAVIDQLKPHHATRQSRANRSAVTSSIHLPSTSHLTSGQVSNANFLVGQGSWNHQSHTSFASLGIRWDGEDYNSNQGTDASIFDLSAKVRNNIPASSLVGSTDSNIKCLAVNNFRKNSGAHEHAVHAGGSSAAKKEGQSNEYKWTDTSCAENLNKGEKLTITPEFTMEIIGVSDDSMGLPIKNQALLKSNDSLKKSNRGPLLAFESELDSSEGHSTGSSTKSAFRLPFKDRSKSVNSSMEVECTESVRSEILLGFNATTLKIEEEDEPFAKPDVCIPSPKSQLQTSSFSRSTNPSKERAKRPSLTSGVLASVRESEDGTENSRSMLTKNIAAASQLRTSRRKQRRTIKRHEGFRWYYLWFLLPAYDHRGNYLQEEGFELKDLENLNFRKIGFHPKSLFNTAWDFCATIVFILFIWFVPYFISFGEDESRTFWVSLVMSAVFAVDAVISVLTPIPKIPPSTLCTAREYEMMRPSLSEWVRVNLALNLVIIPLAAIPFDIIFSKVEFAHGLLLLRLLWTFRLPAMSSRCAILKKAQGKLDALTASSISKVIPIACGILTFIHLNACSLYYFGETCRNGRMYAQKVDELNDYVKWKNLSAETEKRLLRYYETKYRGKYFVEESLLAEMNESLRAEILLQNTKSLIEKVPFLQRRENDGRDEIFMGRIATALHSQYYVEGDYVTKQGENGLDMFFILSGKLDVLVDGVKKVTLFDGAYIGEVALISKVLRTATVQAAKPSILYRLTYNDFHTVLAEFPDMKARIQALASEREQMILARELSNARANVEKTE
ncbi:anaphase-promoting complex subunit Hcn1 [Chytriomyces hyalinus]|nr:anaphase-promoting complex subunit Hcn1 [Chytriomyces hyalinus]